ncbi:MAG TPA: deoxyhypusine synthase family protein [bacterium]|nr:deoxyhypusine synthase family protein [bacterium]
MAQKNNFKEVKDFVKHNFRHFNSAVVVDASEAYVKHLENGGRMMITLAGAMSTAELGLTLAEMIRRGKVDAITCTGANLEEDLFNLVAHDYYVRVPNYRDFSPGDEAALLAKNLNRVTDTCIPEEEAMRRLEKGLLKFWQKADRAGQRYFPYEFMYQLIRSGDLKKYYQIDPCDSWVVAACEKNLPIFVPGWEDSTMGNMFVSQVRKGNLKNILTVKSGLETMDFLINWYLENSKEQSIGFFQVGGGIAGDFPICVVPLIRQDLENDSCRLWGYFCQISDSTTSYGSYSGAIPNEKITWEKLAEGTPKFVIESDATIVAPLIFAYILAD